MAEIVLTERILKMLEGFPPVQRILLSTTGTLVSTLSAYFGSMVTVENISQEQKNSYEIARAIDLVCQGRVVAHADSSIVVTNPKIRRMVMEGKYGLGHILEILGLRPSFDLYAVGQDDSRFWREYRLAVPGVVYRICETFPKHMY